MENTDKNIGRFRTIISKLEPFYNTQHKESDIGDMKKMLQKASINEVSAIVCGEFKRGKSSFINAFLGENICPTDAGIATSVVSIIKYGDTKKVTRIYGDVNNLQSEVIPFDKIELYAKGTSLEIDNTIILVIEIPSEKLRNGLILMDTPGVGGLDPRHLFLTLYVLPKADVTLFVVDTGEPMSSTELEFYRDKISLYSKTSKIILNKSDLKTKEDLTQLISDTKNKISDFCKTDKTTIDIVTVSSTHWTMYNKNKSEKFKVSSNCETVDSILLNIVPDYKKKALSELRLYILSSLTSLIEKLEYQKSQIDIPDPEAQKKYKSKILELKAIKDDLANPNSSTRKKISKVIRTTQTNVINELTRQSILFSTDCLDQLLKRPEAKDENGGNWVLNQLNMGLESIAAEVDQRILLGFSEVNSILGQNVEVENTNFLQKIDVDLTPAEKDLASKACGLARNALPGMGIASMSGLALSIFFSGPVIIGLGALGAAIGYVYKSNKDQNIQNRIFEIKAKLAPQINIVMNDLKAYVQQRFDTFNESLVESFESMIADIVNEMQQVMLELKNAEEDAKSALMLKEKIQEQMNFADSHRKQVELLLTNPFEK